MLRPFFRARFRRNRPSVELGVELDRGQRVCACLSLVHPHLRPTLVATSSTHVLYPALYAQYTSSRLHGTPRLDEDISNTIIIIYRRTIAYAPNTNTHKPAYRPLSLVIFFGSSRSCTTRLSPPSCSVFLSVAHAFAFTETRLSSRRLAWTSLKHDSLATCVH